MDVPSQKSQFLLLYILSSHPQSNNTINKRNLPKNHNPNFRFLNNKTSSSSSSSLMASPKSPTRPTHQNPQPNFHDFLPAMAGNLGGEGLIGELCNGFELLMDRDKGVITFDSLRRNAAAVLGLGDLTDEDVRCMINEGDFDCDGALNQMEFCVLMFRLSPELMEASRCLVTEVIEEEFGDFTRRH